MLREQNRNFTLIFTVRAALPLGKAVPQRVQICAVIGREIQFLGQYPVDMGRGLGCAESRTICFKAGPS